ncbi:MAG: phospho-N-acetylmuramoyl-pentapeptide-transferase [Rhabdochlamydiaceae bacterium]|nr:phospho-N-acetylmuramoyl-pentapeptide-transferase [Candidatus Amphrikana amoebophyrae]
MILLLFHFLQSQFGIKLPSAFIYSSTRMVLAAITSLLLTIFLGPWFIRLLYQLKIGQPIRKEECPVLGELHKNKEDTPTMGGILMLASILVSALIWIDLCHTSSWILIFTLVSFGFIGACDDWAKLKYRSADGIKSRYKLGLQLFFSLIICLVLIYGPTQMKPNLITTYFFPFVKSPMFVLAGSLSIISLLFSIIVVTGASNAVNLTDGLDGLAAGCIIPVAIVLAVFAFLSNHVEISHYLNIEYINKSSEVGVFMCALASACLGFLWYNGYPAQVFMGDTGSLSLGALIGVASILLRREFLLALIGGVFVIEAVSVILQVASFKLRGKKRIFLCAPLHHHFEYKGWSETKVVLRFWIIGLLLAAIGLFSVKFQ